LSHPGNVGTQEFRCKREAAHPERSGDVERSRKAEEKKSVSLRGFEVRKRSAFPDPPVSLSSSLVSSLLLPEAGCTIQVMLQAHSPYGNAAFNKSCHLMKHLVQEKPL